MTKTVSSELVLTRLDPSSSEDRFKARTSCSPKLTKESTLSTTTDSSLLKDLAELSEDTGMSREPMVVLN